ncbi:sigma 54-interacting transcriptional regulator OrpR [Desulfatiferula olefinivorans]
MHSLLDNYRVILESINDGVFTVNLEGIIMTFNRAAETITGFRRAEVVGRPCREVFHTRFCTKACLLGRHRETGEPYVDVPVFFDRADGRKVPVSVTTALLRDSRGRVFGGVEIFRDLSDIHRLKNACLAKHSFDDIISRNPSMQRYFSILPQIAESRSTVLIDGPTGTGKELMARAIHHHSACRQGPFVAVNCGALPDTLIESELFGYKKGAFTDAKKDKPGRFALANDGTIFLDEIGDVPHQTQVKLLRVLQEKCYEPLGGTRSETTNARIIAASRLDPAELVHSGRFREDLFYRINVIRMSLPPLSERREDIPLLVDHFIERFNGLSGKMLPGVSPSAMKALMQYDYPGNIRELENAIEHAFVLCEVGLIQPGHLPERFRSDGMCGLAPGPVTLAESEKAAIAQALAQNRGKIMATARQLGIDKNTLRRKLIRHGLRRA